MGAAIHALAATPVWSVVGWSFPGVLIGSTIGSRVGKYVPSAIMEKALGVVSGPLARLFWPLSSCAESLLSPARGAGASTLGIRQPQWGALLWIGRGCIFGTSLTHGSLRARYPHDCVTHLPVRLRG